VERNVSTSLTNDSEGIVAYGIRPLGPSLVNQGSFCVFLLMLMDCHV
jgi:hypothetical protein